MRNARVVYGLARSAVRLECSHLDEKSAFRLCGHLVEFVKELGWAFYRPSGGANAVAGC